MALEGLGQSSIPTFATKASMRLNGLENNQILFCLDYDGERRNFITVDADSIIDPTTDVQEAFSNGWIVDFPNVQADKIERKYKFQMNTPEYNNNAQYFSFGKYFLLNDKSKMKVWQNGTELDETGWDYVQTNQDGHPGYNLYSKMIQINGLMGASDVFDFEYTEVVSYGDNYSLKLYSSTAPVGKLRPAMPTKTFHTESWGAHGYLSNATMNTSFDWTLTYTNFDDPSDTQIIEKTWGDRVRIADFPAGLNPIGDFELEVYKSSRGITNNAINKQTRSNGATGLIFMDSRKENEVKLDSYGGNRSQFSGKYYFRLRNITTNEYSEFFNVHVNVKQIPVCKTDSGLALNECIGYMYTSKVTS